MLRRPSPRFNLLHVGLIGLLAAGVGVVASSPLRRYLDPEEALLSELASYRQRYGPARYSQHPEEWLVRDFFGDRRGGVFLDVGAHHYRTFSNTYYLETELGWEGIAVEPLIELAADYQRYRPKTRFRAFFASDVTDATARLFVTPADSRVSSAVRDFTARFGEAESRDVPTITLSDLLDAEGVDRLDFVSMDIELSEPKALAGFDIGRFRPSLVCIEAHPDVRQDILNYFAGHGYVVVGRYLRADTWNLYFTPGPYSFPVGAK